MIVDGDGQDLKAVMRNLEGCMVGGKIVQGKGLSRQSSFASGAADDTAHVQLQHGRPGALTRGDSQSSLGLSSLGVEDVEEDEDQSSDPRKWLRVVGAFDQPRLTYNVGKKHFDR